MIGLLDIPEIVPKRIEGGHQRGHIPALRNVSRPKVHLSLNVMPA
jgi:hypothetical protein